MKRGSLGLLFRGAAAALGRFDPLVMRGLDPRIHHLCKSYAKKMDPRVKPAGDGGGWASADSNPSGTAIAGGTGAQAFCWLVIVSSR